MKTVLITGCSSGFGLETARYFLAQGWQVIATLRTPQADLFPASDRLRVLALDVTDEASIRQTLEAAGPVDVLVNNAGIAVFGAVEGSPLATIREVFETNTLGTIAMTQAVLPQFRQRQAGVVINVTSTVTLRPLPLLAAYTASKVAINSFTECLALELKPFNVRVGLVMPGRAPATRFGENGRDRVFIPEAYGALAERIFAEWGEPSEVTLPEDVAQAVWRMATDPNSPMRVPAGADAVATASAWG